MKVTQLEVPEETPVPEIPTPQSEPIEQVESLPLDAIFDVLSNQRRRQIIEYLNTVGDGRVQVRDLTDQITAWENDISIQEVTYKERKRVYTSLYQSHLPKMDRLGIVEYDQNRGVVALTRTTEQLGTYLNSLDTEDDPEPKRYGSIALATLCVAFVAVSWAGLVPFVSQAGFLTAFVVASTFAATAAIQFSGSRLLGE